MCVHKFACTILLVLFLLAPCAFAAESAEVAVRVPLQSVAEVDTLEAAGFSVDNVRADSATVYLLRSDLPRLQQMGFSYEELPALKGDEKAYNYYHSYDALVTTLKSYATAHPDLVAIGSIGRSVQGRNLWVLHLTSNVSVNAQKPEFKYISTMHGDEPIGTEMILNLIELLINGYGTDSRLTSIVDGTHLWFLPMMNPDGFEAVRRYNANNIDLNRAFPSRTEIGGTLWDGTAPGASGREPEVAAVINWSALHSFVLGANFHSGALLVNYLYDDVGLPSGVYAACPDDALERALSLEYSTHNPPMFNSNEFDNGITNGAAWYVATGSMQDWNYRYLGCIENTIELYDISKKPAGTTLPTFWENNRESMLSYLEAVHWGVRGRVTNRLSGAPLWARVTVADNTQPVFSNAARGDYYRLLLAGTYDLTIEAKGYIPYRVRDVAVPDRGYSRVDAALSNGDVNADGNVNAADIQATVNALLQRPNAPDADVDGLGLGASDLQAVIAAVLGQ